MTRLWNGKIALLSDPHLHDVGSGHAYGLEDADCVRSLSETANSTRVFNESGPALARALALVAEAGVTLCIIAGDLTDDGQIPNWMAAAAVLADHSRQFGTRFFLTPGNHDQCAGDWLDQTKEMVRADGAVFSISSGGAAGAWPAVAMRQIGQAAMLPFAAPFGLCRHEKDLLWESPFGTSDAFSDRIGTVTLPGGGQADVPDLSYLVEPEPGLWLLSIDATVYMPDGDGWRDLSSEGWEAVLRHKPALLDWMTQVAGRARKGGKRLLTFSHYPVIDYLGLGQNGPRAEAGGKARVMPSPQTADRIAATGIGLHLSGHWHMNRSACLAGPRWLTNLALPSTASLPAAIKFLTFQDAVAQVRTVPLGVVPGFDAAFARYIAEDPETPLTDATTYDAFLENHLEELLSRRYLPRDWPRGFADLLRQNTLADLLCKTAPLQTAQITGLEAFGDLYRLERAGSMAKISAERLRLYAGLQDSHSPGGDAPQDALGRMISGLARQARHLPDADFNVDLTTGAISAAAPSDAEPTQPSA